ncbi:hypothetical protein D5086_011170 [Populus alba]|uniref:Uncharacterized protein n=1 Tax=Populus alba TaxID=43335 RepID=A0ACC4CD60_POPAL
MKYVLSSKLDCTNSMQFLRKLMEAMGPGTRFKINDTDECKARMTRILQLLFGIQVDATAQKLFLILK